MEAWNPSFSRPSTGVAPSSRRSTASSPNGPGIVESRKSIRRSSRPGSS